ncbi:F-box/WD repeat-containing protein 12 [Sturnira hondurensis]|uniref:F-box/WD repeat-containing protein 12 n=1 Tax=Sturnira hondurensis TaxID=192404 RepID=UPI00187AE3DD|nr:F-box/WD repeat-containing protein 12 [Sturnira hondurensis]
MEFRLPETPLLRIFSFLDAFSLLQAGQVNKHWNKVAESDHLWRNLCLRKWSLPSSHNLCLPLPSWKQFFFHHMRRQRRMASAKLEDFIYKEGDDNLGILRHMAYLSGSYRPVEGQEKPVLCTVSSRHVLYAWDVQEGTVIWSSPVQQSSIKFLATLPQLRLVFTVDMEETVKVWNCQHEDALAVRTIPRVSFSMEALLAKEDPFLMVSELAAVVALFWPRPNLSPGGISTTDSRSHDLPVNAGHKDLDTVLAFVIPQVGSSEGSICTLTVPGLEMVSIVNVFNHSVDLLCCSPDTRWVLAAVTYQRVLPRVFLAECLLRLDTGRAPLSVSLPVLGCCAACWAPRRANRVTLMFRRAPSKKTGFSTFDVTTERIRDKTVIQAHQVASFALPIDMESPVQMGVSDGTVIVVYSGPQLLLLTISGLPLQRFHDHQLSICHLCVGPLYVLTTSMDNHLHLYMWEDKGRYPYLKSCFDLEHRRGDKTLSCYVSRAICDEVSIVCVVSRNFESSVLVMYSLDTCDGV